MTIACGSSLGKMILNFPKRCLELWKGLGQAGESSRWSFWEAHENFVEWIFGNFKYIPRMFLIKKKQIKFSVKLR